MEREHPSRIPFRMGKCTKTAALKPKQVIKLCPGCSLQAISIPPREDQSAPVFMPDFLPMCYPNTLWLIGASSPRIKRTHGHGL